MNKMLSILKKTVIAIGSILLIALLYILISGNTYFFFMLRHTIFEGRMGPNIDDYVHYDSRVIEASDAPFEWPIHESYSTNELSKADAAFAEKMETKALLVIHNDQLKFEQYWDGYSDSSKSNSWSMAKSMCSHLIGCALKDGSIKSIDQKIGDYLPEYQNDPVTIRHLLTMSSGYDFYESYQNPFGFTARSLYGNNSRKLMKRYSLTDENGTIFNYKSANTQLLGFIISEATGKTLSEYASEKLWKPIGAKYDALWSLDHKNGDELAYCCVNTNARDYAKFGRLYLNEGIVDDDTLIPMWYFNEATEPAPLQLKSGEPNDRYGFQWWCSEYEGEEFFYAHGIDGQYILILPESDLIVVRLGQKRSSERLKGHPTDIYEYLRMAKNMVGL